jgi:hypothetical protein
MNKFRDLQEKFIIKCREIELQYNQERQEALSALESKHEIVIK